jgi:TetR/AcrR family transcriptional regulator, transcriptional repressor for nem operon
MRIAPSSNAQEKLLGAAIELFRSGGYAGTTVDEICDQAGVTKGAFFHHFDSKQALAESCLRQWEASAAAREQAAPYQAIEHPLDKLLACMDFYIAFFEKPKLLKSCLVGMTAQEASETNPALRDAAQACFASAQARFKALLDAACRSQRKRLDTDSLAKLWMATIQGSLLLGKASRDESVIRDNLGHVKEYFKRLLADRPHRARTKTVRR